MKKVLVIIGSLVTVSFVIFMAYIKREGDKHAVISSILNQMGGYE